MSSIKDKLAKMKAKGNQKQQELERLEKLLKPKLWKLTVECDCFYQRPSIEVRYVTSDGGVTEDDVMKWWNKTYYDSASDSYGPNSKYGSEWYAGAPKCIGIRPYEPEKRDWIVMPTKI